MMWKSEWTKWSTHKKLPRELKAMYLKNCAQHQNYRLPFAIFVLMLALWLQRATILQYTMDIKYTEKTKQFPSTAAAVVIKHMNRIENELLLKVKGEGGDSFPY